MFSEWLSSSPTTTAFLLLLVLQIKICDASYTNNNRCAPSSCGIIRNISYPFRLNTDPKECGGDPRYNLSCESNMTVLYLFAGKYYVQAINYHNYSIRLVDAGVLKDDCSTLPTLSLARGNFSWAYEEQTLLHPEDRILQRLPYEPGYLSNYELIIFVNCANPQSSDEYPRYVDAGGCKPSSNINNSSLSSSTKDMHSYVFVGDNYHMNASQLMDACSVEKVVMGAPLAWYDTQYLSKYTSMEEIHSAISDGFELSWINVYCDDKCWDCYPGAHGVICEQDDHTYRYFRFGHIWALLVSGRAWQQKGFRGKLHRLCLNIYARLPIVGFLWGMLQFAKFVFGAPCVIVLLVYKWRRSHLSAYDAVEEFLQSHNNLTPIRYFYSDIKKMTQNFQHKLGEGGFGSVYKGNLRSGRVAAIKMLGKSKANGQEFISEVATIGRIRHVNVVQLIGFCSEGSKRALVYEFMPNGSLDKYIFNREESISLSWGKLFEISLGVARGIQYLHEGCDMQILHFDIKPHNILLDENFIPKVSDFGLARLYRTNGSIASLTAARGTIGYMAPELFYKNIGRVSHKADVYSFGMLLLEMAGRRKNLTPVAEKSSQIYFPFWVYDQVSKGEVTEIGNATEEEMEMIKKMIIVGLWCIQMKPSVRPLMRKVVEMLEGDLESLPLPPRPVLYPEENMAKVETGKSSITDSCLESFSSSTYASSTLDAKEIVDDM